MTIPVDEMIRNLESTGVVVVFATGNDGPDYMTVNKHNSIRVAATSSMKRLL